MITRGQLLWCKAEDKAALQQVVLFNGKGWICNGFWVEEAVQMMYFLQVAHCRLGKCDSRGLEECTLLF